MIFIAYFKVFLGVCGNITCSFYVIVAHTCAIIGLKPLINLRFVVPFRAYFPLHAFEYVTQSTHANNDDNNDDENASASARRSKIFI